MYIWYEDVNLHVEQGLLYHVFGHVVLAMRDGNHIHHMSCTPWRSLNRTEASDRNEVCDLILSVSPD